MTAGPDLLHTMIQPHTVAYGIASWLPGLLKDEPRAY